MTEALLEPLIDSRLHGLAMLWFPKFHLVWVVSRLAFTRYRRQPGGFGPQTHEQRVEEVKRTIAPERLLVYRVQEGWEPLCKVRICSLCLKDFRTLQRPCSISSSICLSRTSRSLVSMMVSTPHE